MKIELPPKFYDDHVDRALPAGTVISRSKRTVLVDLTEDDAREILSDALYYSDPATAAQMGMIGLASSARATVKRLQAVLPPEPDVPKMTYIFANPVLDERPYNIRTVAVSEKDARRKIARDLPRTADWPLIETREPRGLTY